MRAVFGLVLLLGLALAGTAVYFVNGYLSSTEQALQKERAEREKAGKLVEVYVVNKPLKFGDELKKEDVQKILWQEEFLPEGTFSKEEDLFPVNAEPRYISRQMEKFEPILGVKISEPGQFLSITSRLAKGMRAFTIKVDVTSGVSGFIQPGNYVDIFYTGVSPDGSGREVTQLIESGVKVIAIDQSANAQIDTEAAVAGTVTVEVTPEQVGRLAQATSTGKLTLSLVGNNEETGGAQTQVEVDTGTLLGVTQEVEAVAAPEKVCTIKTRKGDQEVETQVECPAGE